MQHALAEKIFGLCEGIGFGTLATCFIRVTLWLKSSHRQTQRIRLGLLRAIMRQEIGWFDTNKAGELSSRLSA
jgi:ABC-type multidrug transport system fused ATPase/permease subunit